MDQKKKAAAKRGVEYLTDCSFDKANSRDLSGETYLSLLQTEKT